jgi:hypothetical protein
MMENNPAAGTFNDSQQRSDLFVPDRFFCETPLFQGSSVHRIIG